MTVRIVHKNVHDHKSHLPMTHERKVSQPQDAPVRTYCWCGYCVETTYE